MMEWEYVKGSEADFKDAPEWCTHVSMFNSAIAWEESSRAIPGNRYQWKGEEYIADYGKEADVELSIIAERRKVDGPQVTSTNKYSRQCKGVIIDVYDVINAWDVTNPALQHLIKKALQAGQRGHKDRDENLHDILASAKRAIELEEQAR